MTQEEKQISLSAYTVLDDNLEPIEITAEEKPMNHDGLEEEIDRFEDWMETYNQADYPTSFTTRDIARHFAKWGAEHASSSSETPKDLEETANEGAKQYYIKGGYSPFPNIETFAYKAGFFAGVKWAIHHQEKKIADAYEKGKQEGIRVVRSWESSPGQGGY